MVYRLAVFACVFAMVVAVDVEDGVSLLQTRVETVQEPSEKQNEETPKQQTWPTNETAEQKKQQNQGLFQVTEAQTAGLLQTRDDPVGHVPEVHEDPVATDAASQLGEGEEPQDQPSPMLGPYRAKMADPSRPSTRHTKMQENNQAAAGGGEETSGGGIAQSLASLDDAEDEDEDEDKDDDNDAGDDEEDEEDEEEGEDFRNLVRTPHASHHHCRHSCTDDANPRSWARKCVEAKCAACSACQDHALPDYEDGTNAGPRPSVKNCRHSCTREENTKPWSEKCQQTKCSDCSECQGQWGDSRNVQE